MQADVLAYLGAWIRGETILRQMQSGAYNIRPFSLSFICNFL